MFMASFLGGPGHVGQSSLQAQRGRLASIKEAMFLTKVFVLTRRAPGATASPISPERSTISLGAFKCGDDRASCSNDEPCVCGVWGARCPGARACSSRKLAGQKSNQTFMLWRAALYLFLEIVLFGRHFGR